MADVRFYQHSALPATPNKHAFYLVGSESAGFDLYLGDKKLNNKAEIDSAVSTLTAELNNKAKASDLTALQEIVNKITAGGGEGGDSLATLRAALNNEIARAQGVEGALQADIDTEKGRVDAANAKISTLEGKMSTAEGKISTLEGVVGNEASGLVKDVVALQTKAETLETAISTEKSRAEGIEAGLRTDVDTIKNNYVSKSEKTELETAIGGKVDLSAYNTKMGEIQDALDLKASDADLDAEIARAKGVEQGINATIALLIDSTQDDEKFNSIKELATWIEGHGTEVEGLTSAIQANETAISTEKTRAENEESGLSTRIKTLEDMSHDFAGADAALKSELEGKIKAKVAKADYDVKMTAIDSKHESYDSQIAALQTKDESLETNIENAKNAAISAAATDATSKADTAEANAKAHANTEVGKVDTKVTNLTTIVEGKASQSDLTSLSQTVGTNSSEISTLKTNLSNLQSSLSATYYSKTEIDNKFAPVNTAIESHKSRLDNIDTSINALNLALTWQPISQ